MVYSGGRYVNYRYNAEGSLAELDYGEGDAAPTATYRFEYDSLGRLIRSQQRDGNAVTQRTEQLYDAANREAMENDFVTLGQLLHQLDEQKAQAAKAAEQQNGQ